MRRLSALFGFVILGLALLVSTGATGEKKDKDDKGEKGKKITGQVPIGWKGLT